MVIELAESETLDTHNKARQVDNMYEYMTIVLTVAVTFFVAPIMALAQTENLTEPENLTEQFLLENPELRDIPLDFIEDSLRILKNQTETREAIPPVEALRPV